MRGPGSKRTLSQPVCTRCDEVVRRPMTKSVPLEAPLSTEMNLSLSLKVSIFRTPRQRFLYCCFCSHSGLKRHRSLSSSEFGARRFERPLICRVTLRTTSHDLSLQEACGSGRRCSPRPPPVKPSTIPCSPDLVPSVGPSGATWGSRLRLCKIATLEISSLYGPQHDGLSLHELCQTDMWTTSMGRGRNGTASQ